jgi:hypothetical protein
MDMSVALIASLHGDEVAAELAARVELEPHRDPFAAVNDLVEQ